MLQNVCRQSKLYTRDSLKIHLVRFKKDFFLHKLQVKLFFSFVNYHDEENDTFNFMNLWEKYSKTLV